MHLNNVCRMHIEVVHLAEHLLGQIDLEHGQTLIKCDCENNKQNENRNHDNGACQRCQLTDRIEFNVTHETDLHKK